MAKIFLSYQREREATVKTLASDLETLGHTVWFDHKLTGGQHWWNGILAAICECDVFVFVLDPLSLASVPCQREYGYASALRKRILPVLAAHDVAVHRLPPELSEIQFVDLRERSPDAVLRLARALNLLPPAAPLPEPLPAPPEVPLSPLSRLAQQVEGEATLSQEAQSVLLLELKQHLANPSTAPDAGSLLTLLRQRPDLLASIAAEIDAHPPQPASPKPSPAPVTEKDHNFDDFEVAKRAFWLVTIAACAAMIVTMFFDSRSSSPWALLLAGVTGAGAWLSVLIIGVSRQSLAILAAGTLAGAAAGEFLLKQFEPLDKVFLAIVITAPASAIITATLHRLITWWRRLT